MNLLTQMVQFQALTIVHRILRSFLFLGPLAGKLRTVVAAEAIEAHCTLFFLNEYTQFHILPSTLLILLSAEQEISEYRCKGLWYDSTREFNSGLPTANGRWNHYTIASVKPL